MAVSTSSDVSCVFERLTSPFLRCLQGIDGKAASIQQRQSEYEAMQDSMMEDMRWAIVDSTCQCCSLSI